MASTNSFHVIPPWMAPELSAPARRGMMAPRPGFYLAVILFLAVFLGGLLAAPPSARAVTFVGGDCAFATQASGYRLDSCKNLTKFTVNDIHLTISHPGLPNVTLDFAETFGCSLSGTCFGPDVGSGGTWNGIGGSIGATANPLVWDLSQFPSVNFRPTSVKITGNWTYNGTAVPEPGAWSLLIVGFAIAGTVLRFRRRRGDVARRVAIG